MNHELEILRHRVDDLETQVLELNLTIYKQTRLKKAENKAIFSMCFFTVPLVCLLILMFGLKVEYQSDKHQISYSNDGLIEISLSCLTIISGAYSLKKYRDKHVIEQSREFTEKENML